MKNSFISLEVYDVMGKKVKTLIKEKQNAGSYSVVFNAGNLASGIYFYRLEAGDIRLTRRMILLK